jgi:plastocyanin
LGLRPLLFLALLLLAGPARAGTITGTISWANTTTIAKELVLRDRHVCPQTIPTKQVVVDARGRVRGALVWIEGAAPQKKLPKEELTIDQVGCTFVPIARVTTVGSTLIVGSSDPVLHNVHIKDEKNATVANFSMPVMGQRAKLVLQKPGVYSLHCEAGHDWMRATIVVLDHAAFAVSDAAGRFALPNVAPGTHHVIAFHPELGRISRTVVVTDAAAPLNVDFSF